VPLVDYAVDPFTFEGSSRDVYRRGTGPAVLVLAEMPGITPKVVEFANRVVDIGCTAVLPHLFGEAGRPGFVDGRLTLYAIRSMTMGCVRREFTTLVTGRTSPIVTWLRALGRREHERAGGPGIGAIGMCFSGGFALAMATDDRLLAPVLTQPGLPYAVGSKRKATIDCSAEDLAVVRRRCDTDGLEVLGLRFTHDPLCPPERFQFLREQLGDGFVAVEIDSSPGNAHGIPTRAHSVVTEHLVDDDGHPTRAALDAVLALFRDRLLVSSTE
jgi:dienelactone hydrolase